jgi:DNA replication ATP-dependent helicase Dna2
MFEATNEASPYLASSASPPSREQLIQLQREIGTFVQEECQKQRENFQQFWRQPIQKRVQSGRCLTGLRLERITEERILHFSIQNNESDFREGDPVLISTGNAFDPICNGHIYHEEDSIRVILNHANDWQPVAHNVLFTLDRSFIDLEKFYARAIHDLGETDIGRDRILPLLAGIRLPSCDLEIHDQVSDQAGELNVNDAQADAIAAASSTDLCFLIQGPPGTGKTHVLAQIVRNRLALGERILVCASTHRAIHNALNKIAPLCPGQVCKIDGRIFDPELKVQQFENFASCPFANSGGGYVIGATPFATQGRLSGIEFDTVFMDEAGQITLPLAIMAMLAGKVYIIIGDHKQLPPVVLSRPLDEINGLSIFHRLHGRGFDETLNITYRMNQPITNWPSEQFYFGDLTSHPSVASRLIHYPGSGKEFDAVLNPKDPIVFIETPAGEDRTSSDEEAILIRDLLEELIIHRKLAQEQIAVVVPFRKQSRRIHRLLRDRKHLRSLTAELVIDTVERMQGQERDLIIFGFTASDPLFIHNREDFLFQPNRINVAVTRARSKLIILGSRNLLERSGSSTPESLERRAQFQTLLAAAKHIKLHG